MLIVQIVGITASIKFAKNRTPSELCTKCGFDPEGKTVVFASPSRWESYTFPFTDSTMVYSPMTQEPNQICVTRENEYAIFNIGLRGVASVKDDKTIHNGMTGLQFDIVYCTRGLDGLIFVTSITYKDTQTQIRAGTADNPTFEQSQFFLNLNSDTISDNNSVYSDSMLRISQIQRNQSKIQIDFKGENTLQESVFFCNSDDTRFYTNIVSTGFVIYHNSFHILDWNRTFQSQQVVNQPAEKCAMSKSGKFLVVTVSNQIKLYKNGKQGCSHKLIEIQSVVQPIQQIEIWGEDLLLICTANHFYHILICNAYATLKNSCLPYCQVYHDQQRLYPPQEYCCDGLKLDRQTFYCVATCPVNSFVIQTVCEECPQACETCNKLSCESCKAQYQLISGQCLIRPHIGVCQINQAQSGCSTNFNPKCRSSFDGTLCYSCIPGFFLQRKTFTCLRYCPILEFYRDTVNNVCASCPSSCIRCDALRCFLCRSGLQLKNNQCVPQAPCTALQYINQDQKCADCLAPCVKCFAKQNNCISCQSGLSLSLNQCIPVCPTSTFASNGVCQLCFLGCLACSSINTCIQCHEGSDITNRCTPFCPAGSFKTTTCIACPYPCTRCTGINGFKDCLTCADGFTLLNGGCYKSNTDNCPDSTFMDSYSGVCQMCPNPCLLCSSQQYCVKCQATHLLYNGACLSTCPPGYYDHHDTQSCQRNPPAYAVLTSTKIKTKVQSSQSYGYEDTE